MKLTYIFAIFVAVSIVASLLYIFVYKNKLCLGNTVYDSKIKECRVNCPTGSTYNYERKQCDVLFDKYPTKWKCLLEHGGIAGSCYLTDHTDKNMHPIYTHKLYDTWDECNKICPVDY